MHPAWGYQLLAPRNWPHQGESAVLHVLCALGGEQGLQPTAVGEEGSSGREWSSRRLDSQALPPHHQESDIKWASRWDTYLTMSDVQIHWFSIINSVVVVFFLSGESCGLEGGENKGLRCHIAHGGLLGCSWSQGWVRNGQQGSGGASGTQRWTRLSLRSGGLPREDHASLHIHFHCFIQQGFVIAHSFWAPATCWMWCWANLTQPLPSQSILRWQERDRKALGWWSSR